MPASDPRSVRTEIMPKWPLQRCTCKSQSVPAQVVRHVIAPLGPCLLKVSGGGVKGGVVARETMFSLVGAGLLIPATSARARHLDFCSSRILWSTAHARTKASAAEVPDAPRRQANVREPNSMVRSNSALPSRVCSDALRETPPYDLVPPTCTETQTPVGIPKKVRTSKQA
jgi:hypothetical protein